MTSQMLMWVMGRVMWHAALKVKVKVKFTLEQVIKAQRGRRGIAFLFL